MSNVVDMGREEAEASQAEAAQPKDSTAPILVSPDPEKWRRRHEKLLSWLDGIWRYVFVPADPPERFANEPLDALAGKLKTQDENVARATLAEAEAIYAEPHDRIESAERRATTLQGTVAIAGSVALAGLGLLLSGSRIRGTGWRAGVAVLLIAFVVCLIACAWRALAATSRIFNYEEPGIERIFERTSMNVADALTYRAAELLRAYAVADMIGSVKVGLLRAAAWWFRCALVLLGLLTILVCCYALFGR